MKKTCPPNILGVRNTIVIHKKAVNRKFKCLQYQLARMIAIFLLPEQRLVIQMSMCIETDCTFHWTTGHIR